ncbi:hypothetical protein NIES593_06715 [Hydrococcus rivularis NIES-593]|uniref:Uncharacterized protein n=2 Tax=Hydrococcus TaxID=1616833 RepID=A0A1U7HMS4_9CYAN|nr:hypothetical protein NIES593_06715 [Hydrococcus rivularis NIES-593]
MLEFESDNRFYRKPRKTMSLKEIFKQGLRDGYLDPTLKAEVMRICHPDTILSAEDRVYLEQLMGAILTGEIAGLHL